MDGYLSRRIKNWAAWQQPDPGSRAQLLELAAGGISQQFHTAPRPVHRRLILAILPKDPPEKTIFPGPFSRHSQLAFLNLEVIWRTSPLRYA
jgi:hypothetical protein